MRASSIVYVNPHMNILRKCTRFMDCIEHCLGRDFEKFYKAYSLSHKKAEAKRKGKEETFSVHSNLHRGCGNKDCACAIGIERALARKKEKAALAGK